MESFFIPYQDSSFHAIKYGKGQDIILCFHGYGEEAGTYWIFEELLGDRYSLIAIDMPFHGKTDWRGPLLFTVHALIEIINRILGSPYNQFILMGYSMGGRVAFCLLEAIPERVKKLVLVAPDGLHKNPWQRFSTQTYIGNRLFKFTMANPGWLFGLMKTAFALRLLNPSIEKFIRYYLDEEQQRLMLYKRWTTMRNFRPSISRLQQVFMKKQIPLHIFFGKYDRVIVAKRGYTFAKKLPSVYIREIEAGHQLLHQKYAIQIAEPLMQE
ncbi:MAG: alpha/beta hydrolase [Chitinophagaceae bacterium]|nr:alpha/beta hydrolase [Chitinophagaceae bacterium]